MDQDPRLAYPAPWEEATALSARLQSGAALKSLHWLRRRYHVELSPVVEMLLRNRMAWCFENEWRPFALGVTLRDAEQFSELFAAAAEGLEILGGFFVHDWRKSIGKALEVMATAPERELEEDEFLRRCARAEMPRQAGSYTTPKTLAAVAISEAREQLAVLQLAVFGREDCQAFHLPQQIEDTIAFLRTAAMTCSRREWSAARHSSGRPIFRRGKRRQLVIESQCATELVQLLRDETNRALLDHVGEILIATFPETCGQRWCAYARSGTEDGKRLRDAVDQLLDVPGRTAI